MNFWRVFSVVLLLSACSRLHPGPVRPNLPVLERGWTYSETAKEAALTLDAGVSPVDFSSPTVDGDHLILSTSRIGLVVIHKENGQVIWKRFKTGETFTGKPVVTKNLIIVASEEGFIHAFRLGDGAPVWKVSIAAPSRAEPVVIGDTVVFSCADESVRAFDVQTGKELWSYRRPSYAGTSVFGSGTPALIGGQIWVGFSDGALVALDANDGSVRMEKSFRDNLKFNDIDARPLSWKENVIVSTYDGKLRMLKRDGTSLWEFPAGGARAPTITTLEGANILVFSSSDGSVYALNLENGRELWHYSLKRGVPTGLAVIDGAQHLVIAASSDQYVYALDLRTGKELSRVTLGKGSGSYSSLVSDSKRRSVYVLSQFSRLYQLRVR